MNLEMQLLFDSLKEAIFIVAKTGAVLYANQPAQKILPLVIGQPLAAGWLSGQLKSIRRGYLKPPVTFEIDAPRNGAAAEQTDRLHVTLLTSPVPGDFIVVMQTTTTEQMYQNVISNLAEMLDSEFRAPMEKFLGSAADMLVRFEGQADKDWELRESVARVSRMGTELTALLQQIGLLASTYKASPMRGEDRIPVSELVADVVRQQEFPGAGAGRLSAPPRRTPRQRRQHPDFGQAARQFHPPRHRQLRGHSAGRDRAAVPAADGGKRFETRQPAGAYPAHLQTGTGIERGKSLFRQGRG
ncbi:MAG: hypothetical protein NT083_01010 [Rhodocyclales bacterium]|nr:hypothetical protein [Rhodocyclales bacterium]